MVRYRPLRYDVIPLKLLTTYIRKSIMHYNILWDTLSYLINVPSSRKILLVFSHLIWVTVIATSLLDV